MKYQLLWAACFVGLLQLSAVASRSTVDEEIINKENAKYSTTTVGPTVAYTGQEVERGVNSSDKLAVDPGLMSSDTVYSSSSEVWIPICVFSGFFGFMILICACRILQRRQQINPGSVVTLQNGGQINQVQNFQPQYNSPWKPPSLPTDSPPPYESIPQYQPVHHVGPYQYSQHQVIAPTTHSMIPPMQAQTQQRPPVVEFENPMAYASVPGELANK